MQDKEVCGYCHDALQAGQYVVVCPGCKSVYHKVCWSHNGNRCAVLGCPYAIDPVDLHNTIDGCVMVYIDLPSDIQIEIFERQFAGNPDDSQPYLAGMHWDHFGAIVNVAYLGAGGLLGFLISYLLSKAVILPLPLAYVLGTFTGLLVAGIYILPRSREDKSKDR